MIRCFNRKREVAQKTPFHLTINEVPVKKESVATPQVEETKVVEPTEEKVKEVKECKKSSVKKTQEMSVVQTNEDDK